MGEKVPYLAGCVLYLLLRKATLPDASPRQHRDGVKDEHRNPAFMADLVYTFTGVAMPESETDTSRYREGKKEGTANVPFNDSADISSYDGVVRNRYPDALKRMCEFCGWHINPEMREWFVKACLDIIEHDEDIDDSDEFCVKSSGAFETKAELMKETYFEFQPFVLGVLHYILLHRAGKNSLGIPTMDLNSEKVPRKERKYNGSLGANINRRIEVVWYEMPAADTQAEESDENPDAAEDDNEEQFVEAEVIEDEGGKEESFEGEGDADADCGTSDSNAPETKTTVIHQQTNVIQNGDNNINLTNNGTINFNF